MLSEAVAAGEGAFSTLMTRSVSSITKSSTIFPSGLTVCADAGGGPVEVFGFDFGQEALQRADEGAFAEAAVHFVQADAPVARGQSPEAGIGECFGEVAEVDGRIFVAFAGEGKDGVGAAFDHTAHAAGEVNAEKRVLRIGDGVDQHFHEMLAFRAEGVEFAAKGNDQGGWFGAAEAGDAVAVEASAVDDLSCREFAGCCFDDCPIRVAADGRCAGGGDDAAAALGDDVGESAGDLAVIDDTGFGDVDAGNAGGAMRFQFADAFGADAGAIDAVLRAAFGERFEARHLRLLNRDNNLAA